MADRPTEQASGLPGAFLKDLMALGESQTFKPNHVIFRQGEPAEYFYILVKGKVDISVGEIGHTVYTVSNPGEVFGWSCVLGRGQYSATAEAKQESTVTRIKGKEVKGFLEKDPAVGMIFYRTVAAVLVNRLLQIYRLLSEVTGADSGATYGTGQILTSKET